ncbi:SDR family NAD(P)-dependent oxidoreductase [Bacillus sp. Y1]|nr:SDR family NAD(P)-dependent oxidoreductase [Bacillus sp. Y1]
MKTIAIIGAGPGFGLSIAKKFGSQQFNVALIARNSEKLVAMAEELKTMDIQAKHYLADVRDLSQLQDALCAVKNDFGGIDVLEFSPYAGPETFRHVLETTPESVMNKYTATYCQLSNL